MLANKFLGAYGRIVLDMDTKPLWVESEEEAAEIITVCKMQPMDRPSIKPRIHKRLATDDLRVDMLSTIKGVSESKAERLINEFGSIMEIGEQKAPRNYKNGRYRSNGRKPYFRYIKLRR